jgi:serine/threonine-protein kinase
VGDEPIGTIVGDYRIESVLGGGGQGMVYLAEHVHLGRKAALKLLRPELAADPEFRERFIREARLAATLDHPNVLPVYDAGEDHGMLFLAQKLVHGMDLGAMVEREGHLRPGAPSSWSRRSPAPSTRRTTGTSSTATSSRPTS